MRIAIASGKGGTGKTLISTNLFYVLKETGNDVTLADCDAEEPNSAAFFNCIKLSAKEVVQKTPVIDQNLCTYCGKCEEYCSYNAIFLVKERKLIKVMEDLCHGCGACSYACTYGAITEKENSLGEVIRFNHPSDLDTGRDSLIVEGRMRIGAHTPVPIIKAAVREAGTGVRESGTGNKGVINEAFVILDSPPGTSCPFIHTVSSADFVLLVTEPTPFGVSDLKISVSILRKLNKPFAVIVNRAGLGSRDVYDYLSKENIRLAMEIPFDREIAGIYSEGGIVAAKKDDLRKKFEKLAYSITEQKFNN
ncbi:MAG: ATP-binding protein [Bacteroidales bacterium]|nr:ATP-binding protein [Bacteroidales bacterium]